METYFHKTPVKGLWGLFGNAEQHELLNVTENDWLPEQELVVKLTRQTTLRSSLSGPIKEGEQVCPPTPV